MATRTVTCVVAACDLCGNTRDAEGGEPHHTTEQQAIDTALADDWQQLPDGRLICWWTDTKHQMAREEHGQTGPGPDAMAGTYAA